MFGKKISEYVQFDLGFLVLIAVVFGVRLGLSLVGVSIAVDRWVSINIVLLLGLIYCSVAVHTTGFGSYKHLFGLLFLQAMFAHVLIASGIALSILTKTPNIYTAPEYFGGSDGATWAHVGLHFLGGAILAVIAWLIGSAILFITKRVKA